MWDIRTQFYKAALQLIIESQKGMEPTVLKTKAAQEIYFLSNGVCYSEKEVRTIRYFLDVFLYKYQLASYSLEQLWTVRDAKVEDNILAIAKNSIESLELSSDEIFFQSQAFEQFLFQSRSCLDFFMLYISHLFRTGHNGPMSTKKFYKGLSNAKPSILCIKVQRTKKYFEAQIFSTEKYVDTHSPTNWGELLKSLRDKIAHKDKINFSKNSPDRIMNNILLDFPTIKDLKIDRFCQAMENGMVNMIHDLFPVLFDLEWQAGPYRKGMFET